MWAWSLLSVAVWFGQRKGRGQAEGYTSQVSSLGSPVCGEEVKVHESMSAV